MSGITYRSVKGSRLTSDEVDANFAYLDQDGNRIVTDAGFTVVGQDITMNAGYEWQILGVDYTNASDVALTIPYADSGKQRIDLIVANSSNTFERIAGVESASNPATPAMQGKVVVTVIDVTDGTVGGGTATISGETFVKKSFAQPYAFDGTGTNQEIPLDLLGREEIRLTNASLESIKGFNLSLITGNPSAEQPYIGKRYRIRNLTGVDITLKHNDLTAGLIFLAKDGADVVIPDNEVLEVVYAGGGFEEGLRSWSSGGGGSTEGESSTGNNILFDNITGKYYNESSPLTGDLTFDETNAKKGGKAIIYHSEDSEPVISLPFGKKINTKKGEYVFSDFGLSFLNRIEATRTPNGNFDIAIQSDYSQYAFDEDLQEVIDLARDNGDEIPSTDTLLRISSTLTQLKADSVFERLDVCFLMASEFKEFSKYCYVRKLKTDEVGGALVFSSTGFAGASGKALNTNFNPSTDAVNYLKDDAGIYVYINGSSGTGYYIGGYGSDTTKRVNLGDNSSNTYYTGLNSSGLNVSSVDFSAKHLIMSRNNSTEIHLVVDGTDTVSALASTDVPTVDLYMLCRNGNGSVNTPTNGVISVCLIGSSLHDKANEIQSTVDTYLDI